MASNNLVTLSEVKGRLHISHSEDDANLSQLIGMASTSILRWLKSDGDEYRDTSGELIPGQVPDDIKGATMWLVGAWYNNPDMNEGGLFEAERLPAPVEAILHSRREPTLA
jgi:hypothetical protein